MNDFIDGLNDLFRYNADAIAGMLPELEDTRSVHLEPKSHHRLVLADAMDESGREAEGRLLRSDLPIYVWKGGVYHARGGGYSPPHTAYMTGLEQFQRGHKATALWAENDEEGNPLDDRFGWQDYDEHTEKEMDADAAHFYHSHHHLFGDADPEHAGHDFWLSRNGHGTGFFDGNYGDHNEELQRAANAAGEYSLYADHDDEHEDEIKVKGHGGRGGWGQPAGISEHPQ